MGKALNFTSCDLADMREMWSEGMPFREIGERMGCSGDTVRRHLGVRGKMRRRGPVAKPEAAIVGPSLRSECQQAERRWRRAMIYELQRRMEAARA